MGTPRPTGVTVIAILAIVFGALGICGGAASLPMLAMDPSSVPDLPSLRPYFENDALRLHMKVNAVVGVTASLALVAAGIGMLSLRPWARTTALVWSVVSLLSSAVGLVVLLTVYLPALDRALEGVAEAQRAGTRIGAVLGGFLGGCFGLAVPVAVLVVLTRPASKAAFGLGGSGAGTGDGASAP